MGRQQRAVYSTIEAPLRAAWCERVTNPPQALSRGARIRHVVREGGLYPAVILDGSEKDELLVAALLARRRRPRVIVIADATWKLGRNPLDLLASRSVLRVLDAPNVHYAVFSSYERDVFPRTWRVDPARVVFTPYHHTLSDQELQLAGPGDGRVFAGGVSLRDYGTLVEAMRRIPHALTIATTARRQRWMRDLPQNVTVRATTRHEYTELVARASVVVVPLERRYDRGAGQTTYLNAMALGRATVVTDVPGASDYIRDGENGLLVPPADAAALARALRTVLEDPAYATRLGEAARRDACARFGPDRYVERLLTVVDEALAGNGHSGS